MTDARKPIRVLGVLAGADMPPEQLKRWVESADVVIAADGGANRLHEVDVIPKTTLGDLDSISEASSEIQKHLIRNEDQNSTDCDKLLQFAIAEGYDAITLAGVEGDLLDHVLGTIQSAARSPIIISMALRRGIGYLAKGPCSRTFETIPRCRFSVIPLEPCHGVSITGTRWLLSEAELHPLGLTSLSNIAEGTKVDLQIERGRAFVFVETDGLPRWDVR